MPESAAVPVPAAVAVAICAGDMALIGRRIALTSVGINCQVQYQLTFLKEAIDFEIQWQINEIEEEMARTQKNKATAHHLGLLKAKLAKLKRARAKR